MLRKLCTADNWSKLSLLKLKEELAQRGLKRIGTREELISRLKDNDYIQILSNMKIRNEDLGKSSLNNLSSSFLLKEILKRNQDFLIPSNCTKKQLLDFLSSLLIDERGHGAIDLRYIILKSNSGLEQIPLSDIFQVLNNLKDPYQISQLDINILLNTEPTCMAPIWNHILNNIEQASFPQLISFISSMHTLQDFFKKRINAELEKFSSENIEKVFVQALKISDKTSSLEIARLLTIANLMLKDPTPTILALKNKMLDRAGNLEDINPLDLFYILENLPVGCNKTHKQFIENTLIRVYDVLPDMSSEKLLGLLFGLYNSGAEIPFNVIYYIDLLPKEFLKKSPPITLNRLAKILSEKGVLSEDIGNNIIEVLASHNLLDTNGLALYVDTLYALHKNDSFSQVINRINLLSKCLIHENNLNLDSLLKLCVIYLPHMIKEDLFSKLLIDLSGFENSDKIFVPKIDLLEDIQKGLLLASEELPIYNYQFSSFRVLGFKEKVYLVNKIHNILKYHKPNSPVVFSFYNSFACSENPELSLFSTEITSNNLLSYSMALWKYRDCFNSADLLPIINSGIKSLKKLDPENMEALYYMISTINKIPETLEKQDIKLGNFYLAIYQTLNWTPENIENTISNLEAKSLFGEPLIKTMIMIMIHNIQDSNLILKTSANLNFIPRWQPKISQKLVKDFVKLVINNVQDINYHAFSSFILENFDAFIEKPSNDTPQNHDLAKIFSFLKNNWEQVNPELQSKLNKTLDFTINEMLIMDANAETRKKIGMMQQNIECTYKNLEYLEVLSKHKMFIPSTINRYLNLAESIQKEQDLINMISCILKILSFSGNQKGLFDTVFNLIDKYQSWHFLSLDDLINFFFIYYATDSNIKLPINLEDKFKEELLQNKPTEQQMVSIKNSLKYYKSFKYTTQFEPRIVVSNNMNLREDSPEVSLNPELPTADLMRYLKIKAIHNKYDIPATDDCVLAVKMWQKQKDRDLTIKHLKQEILNFIDEKIRLKSIVTNYTENLVDSKTGWRIDMAFNSIKLGLLLFSETDCFYNEKGNETGIDAIHHLIMGQLKTSLNYNIFPLTPMYWNTLTIEKKQILFAPLVKILKK
ncbi:hypothetical protein SteCoe_32111 [Stentor coeruleus]|uniref:SAP domain-containing protein n=1 Tax=Stentor coeruleus TaxID=5963 RepID=A0A1R2AZU1_9CILI|nr:hypothetical protein SteCoe_32111 [Stentor coeruleus]